VPLHIVAYDKMCLYENKTVSRSTLFSSWGVHVCAPVLCMFSPVGHSLLYVFSNVLAESPAAIFAVNEKDARKKGQ
jgi:hypothetical protein